MADKPIYDIIIIGGGPVGLYGLYYAGMRDMKALLIESLSSLGGQLSVYYPEKYIYNIPGHKKILSKEFVRITLINKLDKFVALEANVKRLLSSDIDVRLFHELKQVIGKERVKAAVIYNNKTMEEERLEIDAVLLNTGFLVNLEPLTRWGLELEGNSIKVNYRMETNLEGVYAAGDIASHPGKLKLISTGAGEAAIAISNAKKYILTRKEIKGKKGSAAQKG